MGENVIIFEADMSSSVHIHNENKDILILSEGPTKRLGDTTLTAEATYPVNFTQPNKRFVLSLHWSKSFLFVNATKKYQFKAKDSEMKDYALCLGNIKDFTINNVTKKKKKNRIKGIVKFFSVDYNPIDTNDILDIHKHLMKGTWYKITFELTKKIFIELLTGTVSASNHTKCMSLSN